MMMAMTVLVHEKGRLKAPNKIKSAWNTRYKKVHLLSSYL